LTSEKTPQKIKFNIGAWKHYNSFDENCMCHLCNEHETWMFSKRGIQLEGKN